MLIKNLTKREKMIASATLAVGILAFAYAVVIEPACGRWGRLSNETASAEGVLKKDMKILSMNKVLEADYAKLSKYAKSAKKAEESMADILTYIEAVSRDDSCLIINIKPLGVKEMGSHKAALIDVTAEADMSQFSKFLYDIENSPQYLLRVRRFTISSKSGQTGTLRGTFLISKILLDH